MKIFFHAPLRQKETDDYLVYFKYLEELGHTHVTDLAVKYSQDDLKKTEVRDEARAIHSKQEDKMKKADVVVLGASGQSVGIGFFFAMASKLSKPIIVICDEINKVPFFFDAVDYNKLIVIECTPDNYKKTLAKALAQAEKLIDKRFTLLLPPEVVEMLDNHYIKTGETRSEYIRDLIRQDQIKKGYVSNSSQ